MEMAWEGPTILFQLEWLLEKVVPSQHQDISLEIFLKNQLVRPCNKVTPNI
jgi:hypothetical protein